MKLITPLMDHHGVGYLEVILAQLLESGSNESFIKSDGIDQYHLLKKIENATLKDEDAKLTVLAPKDYKEPTCGSLHKWKEFSDIKAGEIAKSISKSSQKLKLDTVKELLEKTKDEMTSHSEAGYIGITYSALKDIWNDNIREVWHFINLLPIATQIEWLEETSPLISLIEIIPLKYTFDELESESNTIDALREVIGIFNDKTLVNIWGVRSNFTLCFHYLKWSSPKFKNTPLVKIKTAKTHSKKDEHRFREISVTCENEALLEKLQEPPKQLTQSQSKSQQQLSAYKSMDDNFTIFIGGERGTGKTKLIKEVFGSQAVEVNCAALTDRDLARSELFGHTKGAFTGANSNHKGALSKADGGTLFLDEIHHLEKNLQAMLLAALQTDKNGNFTFTPLGSNKSEQACFQLICASNRTDEELRESLLPDFYDRITQRIVQMEAIRPGKEVADVFSRVWDSMDFRGDRLPHNPIMTGAYQEDFTNWLTSNERRFSGNFRDLQKIAILAADFQRLPKAISGKSLVKYLKDNFQEKPCAKSISIQSFLDEHGSNFSLKSIEAGFKKAVIDASINFSGSQKDASVLLGITEQHLSKIKNR